MNSKSGIKPLGKPPASKSVKSTNSKETLSRASSLASVSEGIVSASGKVSYVVGDKVWVNGTKPGTVQFIGETQFAPGVWAGVKLEDTSGKNDGSVNGVKYFDCEPLRGIFIRPHRLTREAGSPPSGDGDSPMPKNSNVGAKQGISRVTQPSPSKSCSRLRPGERVVVNSASGTKCGTLRFVGSTDFAAGEWAGIELDEPVGKNDGSVGGKRYFECKMKYGLFAPMHKVSCVGGTITPRCNSAAGSLHGRSYSRESLNSTTSSVASSRANRVKLGITSLSSGQKAQKGASALISPTQSALQESLKEKEEHIQQLLKERETVRNDIAKLAAQATESEEKYNKVEAAYKLYVEEKEQEILLLKTLCEEEKMKTKENKSQLEEERRKIEDLQFRLEEEMILKSDLEAQREVDKKTYTVAQGNRAEVEELLHQINTLKESFAEIECKGQAQQSEMNLLRDSLQQKEAEIVQLQQQLDEEKKNVATEGKKAEMNASSSAAALEIAEKKVLELTGKIESLSDELKSKTTATGDYDKKLSSLERSLNESNNELVALKLASREKEEQLLSELAEKDGLYQTMESTVAAMQKRETKLKEDMEQKAVLFNKEIEKLTNHLNEKDQLCVKLKEEVSEFSKELEEKGKLADKAFAELKEARMEVSCLSKDKSEGVVLLQNQIAQMKSENEATKTELEKSIKLVSEEKEKLSGLLKQKESEIQAKGEEILNLKNTASSQEQEVKSLKQQLVDAKEKSDTLSRDLQTVQEEVKKMKSDRNSLMTEKEKSIQSVMDEKDNLMNLLKQKENEAHAKSTEILNLQNSVSSKEQELQGLKQQLHDAKCKSDALSQDLQAAQEEVQKLKSESHSLVTEKEQNLQALQDEISKYTALIEQRTKENASMQEQVKQLYGALQTKESNISELAEMVEASQKQLQMLKQENENNVTLLESRFGEFKAQQETHLKEKEQKLVDEIHRLEDVLNEKSDLLKRQETQLSEIMTVLQQKDTQVKSLEELLREKDKDLKLKMENELSVRTEMLSQAEKLKSYCESLEKEKAQIISQVRAAEEARKELEKTKDTLINDKVEQETLIKDREAKLEFLQREVMRMQSEFILHKEELQQKLDVSRMELDAMREFKAELEVQHEVHEELQQQLQNSENECTRLQALLQNSSTVASENKKLEDKLKDLQEQLQKQAQKNIELEEENKQVHRKHEELKETLKKVSGEMEAVKADAQSKHLEQSDSLKNQLKTLEEENKSLKQEVSQLKKELSANNNASSKTEDDQDEKETLLSQINFLNSIIVDMQKQNEELKRKQDAFFQDATEMVEADLNLNGVKQIPPRLFCDICDMFDLHDTEDCPKQSSFIEDEATHSHHHGDRHEERPYCNNCEVFGHWTLDCDDQQTF